MRYVRPSVGSLVYICMYKAELAHTVETFSWLGVGLPSGSLKLMYESKYLALFHSGAPRGKHMLC